MLFNGTDGFDTPIILSLPSAIQKPVILQILFSLIILIFQEVEMTVPPVLLSHESTEHYTPQYILDAVIACMGTIDLDPRSNNREIPNVPAARHFTARDNGLV